MPGTVNARGGSSVLNELTVYWERKMRKQETICPPIGAMPEIPAWRSGVYSILSQAFEVNPRE